MLSKLCKPSQGIQLEGPHTLPKLCMTAHMWHAQAAQGQKAPDVWKVAEQKPEAYDVLLGPAKKGCVPLSLQYTCSAQWEQPFLYKSPFLSMADLAEYTPALFSNPTTSPCDSAPVDPLSLPIDDSATPALGINEEDPLAWILKDDLLQWAFDADFPPLSPNRSTDLPNQEQL